MLNEQERLMQKKQAGYGTVTLVIDRWDLTPGNLRIEKQTFLRNRALIFVLTFGVYICYHIARRPVSIVKNVLHRNCSGHTPVTGQKLYRNGTGCQSWAPFDRPNYETLYGAMDLAFLFSYAIGMFISGHVAERVNIRSFLSVGMVLTGIFTALLGLARYLNMHSLTYFIILQILAGSFQSTGWPSVVTCTANWFGKRRRGFVMGVWNSHTSIGNAMGSFIAGSFVSDDWGLSFIVPGAIITAMGVVTFILLRPHPKDAGCKGPEYFEAVEDSQTVIIGCTASSILEEEEPLLQISNENTDKLTNEKAITPGRALMIPGVVEFSLCLFFAKLVSYTFLFWLPKYISDATNYGPSMAADLSTIFDLGGMVGGITAGIISDLSGARASTCLVMLLLATPAIYIYQLTSGTLSLNIFGLFVSGALVNGPYSLITTAVAADLGSHPSLRGNAKALSTVTSIIDGTGSLGAAVGPLLTSILSGYGWNFVFYMLIIADVLAVLFLVRLVHKEIRHGCGSTR